MWKRLSKISHLKYFSFLNNFFTQTLFTSVFGIYNFTWNEENDAFNELFPSKIRISA